VSPRFTVGYPPPTRPFGVTEDLFAEQRHVQHFPPADFWPGTTRVLPVTREGSPGTSTNSALLFEAALTESVAACLRVGLLVTEGDHGVDAHRAAGRNVAGGEGRKGQDDGDTDECGGVGGLDLEE
jgi:hypothetical protein